jgi:tetratricopeptide (TPR) repeat protein
MKISRRILLAVLSLLLILNFIQIGFPQEIKGQNAPPEKTNTNQHLKSKYDLKVQETKKDEEKKSILQEEPLIREPKTNLDKSINILNIVATLIGVLVGLLTLIIIIAIALGLFEYRKYRAIINRAERHAKIIERIRTKAEKDASFIEHNLRHIMSQASALSLIEKPPKEMREQLDKGTRAIELMELLGLPLRSDDYFMLGMDSISKKKYERALEYLDKSIALDQNNGLAWVSKSFSLFKLERYEEALKASEKTIEVMPSYYGGWHMKGASLAALEKYEESIQASDRAIDLGINIGTTWRNKGVALYELGRYEEAISALSKALELEPKDIFALEARALSLYKLGRKEEAFKDIDKAIELSPEEASFWNQRARLYSMEKDKEKTLRDLSKAIELDIKYKTKAKKNEDFKYLWDDEDFNKITS